MLMPYAKPFFSPLTILWKASCIIESTRYKLHTIWCDSNCKTGGELDILAMQKWIHNTFKTSYKVAQFFKVNLRDENDHLNSLCVKGLSQSSFEYLFFIHWNAENLQRFYALISIFLQFNSALTLLYNFIHQIVLSTGRQSKWWC